MGQAVNVVLALVMSTSLAGWKPDLIFAAENRTQATGPATEKRFPRLRVPDGFRATLFACDPLIEYPSVISIGPNQGTLFVAYDYMTGLGLEIVKRDEIRLVSDSDGDGYADKSQFYAGGFNSIQGLAFSDGWVFVMHAPLLTVLRDTDGDGVADVRRNLFGGLGLSPEDNPIRLHCANGVVVGHDGWLYLALGDRGCDVRRPEGDRLRFREGGILRCRPDGRDLHVFASGLRNIYDVALDEELNVFVRDNENDGGDYMVRVCLSFHGADHGYPYLYRERAAEAMPPLAVLGRGSSAGGTAYLETAFPNEFRNSLYFCEWGRAVVRYPKERSGSSFQPMQEVDFAAGSPDDPYGFKPTDLVVDYDGTLLISDWCDGQRPKRGRGRIYRISVAGKSTTTLVVNSMLQNTSDEKLIKLLGSPSHHQRFVAQIEIERRVQSEGERGNKTRRRLRASMKNRELNALGRMHAVWIIAHCAVENTIDDLLDVAGTDPDSRVQVQAVRAVADLTDPVLTEHKIAAGRGEKQFAVRLAELGKHANPRVGLEVLAALGRLHWSDAPAWISQHWKEGDSALDHAAMQLLRRSNHWSAVLKLLDVSDQADVGSPGLRTLALRALSGQAEETIVDGIVSRWESESHSVRRGEYVDLLSRVYKKPAEWTYWGFRPAPRPANTVVWERTNRIGKVLNRALADAEHSVRKLALERMRREKVPVRLAALTDWLRAEKNSENVAAILEALQTYPADDVRPLLAQTIVSKSRTDQNRLAALDLFNRGLNRDQERRLLNLAEATEDGPVLAAVLAEIGRRPRVSGDRLLLNKLDSQQPDVRSAALEALGRRKTAQASSRVLSLFNDRDLRVRRVAASVAGVLRVRNAVALLLKTADDDDAELRRASLVSLHQLNESGAVPLSVSALEGSETQLAALNYLADFGSVHQLGPVSEVAATNRSVEVLTAVARVLSSWQENPQAGWKDRRIIQNTLAEVQGDSGFPLLWSIIGPIGEDEANSLIQKINRDHKRGIAATDSNRWQHVFSAGTDAVVNLKPAKGVHGPAAWLGFVELITAKSMQAQFLASSEGTLQMWINGKLAYSRDKAATFQPNSDRFEATLVAGTNRLLVWATTDSTKPQFQVRFRPKSSKAEHERLTQLVLEGRGSVERGRKLFANVKKSLCIKCHRIGEQGGRIGPDLTGVGSRFSRIHLIESILEPSRTVAPSYGTTIVLLNRGKVLTGVKTAETSEAITLGDKDGKLQVIPRSEIEELRVDRRSTMPDGLEKQMTDRELKDLIAFLVSQKKPPNK